MKKIIEKKIISILENKKISEVEVIKNINSNFGEYSTNLAMKNSRKENHSPLEYANNILDKLKLIDIFENVSIAGPGFINFDIKKEFLIESANKHFEINYNFFDKRNEKINYEYISANPTGSLHLGHARNAFVGDVVARILEYVGYTVKREYYLNDNGSQIDNLGISVNHFLEKLKGEPLSIKIKDIPYKGQEIEKYAKIIYDENCEMSFNEIKKKAMNISIKEIKETILRNGLKDFDEYVSEKYMFTSGAVKKIISSLEKTNKTFKEDGALWLRTTDFGDDKDRVLIKSDGTFTYLVGDIANHMKKFDEGFEKIIDLWGTDHHGYEKRVKAAIDFLGYDSTKFEVDFINMVKVSKDGKDIKMSKRQGTGVTMDYLNSLVDPEILRFFILNKTKEQNQKIDIEEILTKNNSNPYWYMQYAYARASQILAKFLKNSEIPTDTNLKNDVSDIELSLIKEMIDFEDKITIAAEQREPFVLITYLKTLANTFHSYYNNIVVISDDPELTRDRIIILISFRNLLSKAFNILGIKPKEKM